MGIISTKLVDIVEVSNVILLAYLASINTYGSCFQYKQAKQKRKLD